MATPAYLISDPTEGLELVDGRAEGTEATRYVFLALDVLDPERRDQMERLRRGGEEVNSHCLRRTPNFVPRCFITPVEQWVEHMPLHAVPEGTRSVEVKDPTLEPAVMTSSEAMRMMTRGRPLRAIRTYPGDEMSDITGVYQKVGIVELEALKGTEWDEGIAQRLQEEFFPSNWILPVSLRGIEEQIASRREVHPLVADDMTRGCGQSRRWAQARLQAEHVLLDTRVKHEWTYTYSPIARSLLAQLELTPRDQGFETLMAQGQLEMARAFASASGGSALDVNALATAIATAIVSAQTAGKSVEQVKDEIASQPKSVLPFRCNYCDKGFDSAVGKKGHEQNCPKKPTTE